VRSRSKAKSADDLTASVVICAYTEARWQLLVRAVESVLNQSPPPQELIVVIDHNPALLGRATAQFSDAAVVIPSSRRVGLSGARNSGIAMASGQIVAFLDDDAVAEPGWLKGLLAPFSDPDVFASGGLVQPEWQTSRPRWMPIEFDWVIGCSFAGQAIAGPVRNPIGASMAFRRSVFENVGGFPTELGRVSSRPVSCEETALCLRAAEQLPAGLVVLEQTSVVRHHVPASRTRFRYFLARCFAEGQSKAIVAAMASSRSSLATERSYVLGALTRGVITNSAAVVHGDVWGLARAAAIALGFGFTVTGYLGGRLSLAASGGSVLATNSELIPAPNQ
jgi:GT2 family glycosyltransferase